MLSRRLRRYQSINIITPGTQPHSQLRDAWAYGIPDFAINCLPNNFPFGFTAGHKKLIDICQIKNELVLISAFRGYGKSTIATFLDPLHKIANNQVNIILFIGFNVGIALQFSGAIKSFLEETPDESFLFRQHYPDVCGPVRGVQDDFKTANGVRIVSLGIGKSPRSKLDLSKGERPDMAIADDYESDDSARSQLQSKNIINYLFKAVGPALRLESMGGHYFRAINTTITPVSAQTTLLDDNERNLKRFYMPLVQDGKSTWEEAIPTNTLERKRKKEGLVAWHSEFLLKPISGDTQIFKDEWFKFIPHDYDNAWYYYTVGAIDVAPTSKKSSDYKAIVVLGIRYDPNVQIVVRHAWQGKVSPTRFWRKVHELQERFDCDFAIERNMLYDFLDESIDKYESRHHIKLRLFGVVHTLNKEFRISRLENPHENGEIIYIENHSHQRDLRDQLKAFPYGVNDDLADAQEEAYQQVIRGKNEMSSIDNIASVDNPVESLERDW